MQQNDGQDRLRQLYAEGRYQELIKIIAQELGEWLPDLTPELVDPIIHQAIQENPKLVSQYKNGNKKVIGPLIQAVINIKKLNRKYVMDRLTLILSNEKK